MGEIFDHIFDWLEVWALFIPLIVFFKHRKQPSYVTSIIFYLFLALFLNSFIDIIWKFHKKYHFPEWLTGNNYLYNINSIIRLLCFSVFFIKLNQPFLVTVKRSLPFIFIGFVIINFTFFQDFFYFNLLS